MTVSRAFAGSLSVTRWHRPVTSGAMAPRIRCSERGASTATYVSNFRVLHRSLRYAGFAPYLGYAF